MLLLILALQMYSENSLAVLQNENYLAHLEMVVENE